MHVRAGVAAAGALAVLVLGASLLSCGGTDSADGDTGTSAPALGAPLLDDERPPAAGQLGQEMDLGAGVKVTVSDLRFTKQRGTAVAVVTVHSRNTGQHFEMTPGVELACGGDDTFGTPLSGGTYPWAADFEPGADVTGDVWLLGNPDPMNHQQPCTNGLSLAVSRSGMGLNGQQRYTIKLAPDVVAAYNANVAS